MMDRAALVQKAAQIAFETGKPIYLQHAVPELPMGPVFRACGKLDSELEMIAAMLNAAMDFDPEATEHWLEMYIEQAGG